MANSSNEGTIRIWNLEDLSEKQILVKSSVNLRSLVGLPNGDLAPVFDNHSIRVWIFNDVSIEKQ